MRSSRRAARRRPRPTARRTPAPVWRRRRPEDAESASALARPPSAAPCTSRTYALSRSPNSTAARTADRDHVRASAGRPAQQQARGVGRGEPRRVEVVLGDGVPVQRRVLRDELRVRRGDRGAHQLDVPHGDLERGRARGDTPGRGGDLRQHLAVAPARERAEAMTSDPQSSAASSPVAPAPSAIPARICSRAAAAWPCTAQQLPMSTRTAARSAGRPSPGSAAHLPIAVRSQRSPSRAIPLKAQYTASRAATATPAADGASTSVSCSVARRAARSSSRAPNQPTCRAEPIAGRAQTSRATQAFRGPAGSSPARSARWFAWPRTVASWANRDAPPDRAGPSGVSRERCASPATALVTSAATSPAASSAVNGPGTAPTARCSAASGRGRSR